MRRLVEVGQLVGGYRLLRCLGAGGFAEVWLASDDGGKNVALKVLHPEHQGVLSAMRRLGDEARILRQLDHRNIPKVVAAHCEERPCFFVMEYVPGENLRARLQQRSREEAPIPLRGVSWIFSEICAAVSHAHLRGVIHRDLKPANIAVNSVHQRPLVKVLDFGTAKNELVSEDERTTQGRIIGSPLYMAPEQLVEAEITRATDVFTLGVMLFELLTLRRAWAVDGLEQRLRYHLEPGPGNPRFSILERIVRGERPRLSDYRPELPRSLDGVVARALAARPEDRFDSVEELHHAFREVLFELGRESHADGEREEHSVITEPQPQDLGEHITTEPDELLGARVALQRAVTRPRDDTSEGP